MSESSLAPAWKRSSLLSLADYHNGAIFNPSHWGEEGLPIIRIEQINNPSAPTDFYNGPLSPQNAVTTGDLIFSWSATLKAVIWRNGDGALNQHLFKVVPKNGTNKAFLKYVLEQNMEGISSGSQGSTMKHITRGELQRYQVEVPELEAEQRRIAEILSTLDEAIQQTEALIAKHQQIKAGLMHDLFTRGVTPDGHLRPTREQAPDLYKDSPLGWIPKEWEPGTLQDLVSPVRLIVYGILMPGTGFSGGIPVVKVKDIIDGEIKTDNLLLTSPEIDAAYQRSKLKSGDVLLTIRGTVGRLAMVPNFLDGANITQDTARIGIARGNAHFYRHYLETDVPRAHFAVNTLGVAVQGINLRDVRTTPVPLVDEIEQELIVQALDGLVSYLRENNAQLEKLRQQKHGLMHDLLTGRVRVKV